MKNKILRIAAILGIAVFAFSPMYLPKVSYAEGIIVPGGKLENIDENAKDPSTLISKVINTLLAILAGIAVLVIIYGGFKYILGGDAGAKEAKSIITGAVVGLIIILLAYAIVNWVVGLFITK